MGRAAWLSDGPAFFTYRGIFMKTEEELWSLASDKDRNSAFYSNSCIVEVDGGLYPMSAGHLLNPLDADELLKCCNVYDDADKIDKILKTITAAKNIIKDGFTVITKLKSGAPRSIMNRDNYVTVLSELSKEKGMYFPLLSVLISDDDWNVSSIDAFKDMEWKRTTRAADVLVFNAKVGTSQSVYSSPGRTEELIMRCGGGTPYMWYKVPTVSYVHRPVYVWED